MIHTVFEENNLEIENCIQNGVELDAADADAPRNATPAAIGSDSLHGALSDFFKKIKQCFKNVKFDPQW